MGASKDEDSLLRELARAPAVGDRDMPDIAVGEDGVRVEPKPPVLAVGELLGGRFEVIAPIGKGGMGEVYRANDRQLGRAVAIKVLAATDAERRRRFAHEARAASALLHPNILTVFDVGEHDGAPYLVMELLEGETLRDKIAHGPIDPTEAIALARQIASGLAAAHGAGIVHRDLKPENLLIAGARIRILDFGLAKLTRDRDGVARASSLTVTGAILGTVSYMSPEALRGEDVDHRSDLFAFGTIVVEMITGRPAFGAGSSADVVTAILRDEVSLAALPATLVPVIGRCLEKTADRRFQSTQDLVVALDSPREGSVVAHRRIPAIALIAGGVAIGAGAVAIYAATRASEPPPPPIAPTPASREPTMHRLTFQRGAVQAARFAADGKTVMYSARWPYRQPQVETTVAGIYDSRTMNVGVGELLAVSKDEIVVQVEIERRSVWQFWSLGKLARASLGGGMPRQSLDSISEADFAPDGSLAVTHVVGDRWRLEWPAGTTLYETAGWIGQPRVSRDGTRLAFVDHPFPEDDSGRIVVIDRAGTRTTLVEGLVSAMGVAWSPSGTEVWFTGTRHGANRELRAVDLKKRERLLYRAPGTLRLFDVSARGEILVDRTDVRARTLRHVGNEPERDLSWLDGTSISDCRDKHLLISESFDGAGDQYGLYLMSKDGGGATRIGDGQGGSFSPDGRSVSSWRSDPKGGHDVFVLPIGPGTPRKISHGDWLGLRWFPNGKRMLLVGASGAAVIHDLESGAETPAFAPRVGNPYLVALSPDGTFVVAQDRERRLSVYPIGGTTSTPIPKLEPGAMPLQFSADGSHLLIVDREGSNSVFVYDVDLRPKGRDPEMTRGISPRDPTGVTGFLGYCTNDYGKTIYASQFQVLSTLYQLGGID